MHKKIRISGFSIKISIRISILLILICFSGTITKAQLIKNISTLADMEIMLQKQHQMASGREKQLFEVFQGPLTHDEKDALEYLYAYLPLSDMADYNGEFFLKQVKSALKARNEMIWGKNVPEDVFLHFVLPLRVNNENLDLFRVEMYDEIKGRITGMNMHDAALEVNHWCHEKMTYRGTDERTSSPLASLKTSFGRCGEESTFTVTAMRTVGIPARQVYTPRWAHTDDNHAWVEVWVDGKWYFLGACEPEPELNMGWFSEPARRAMLVHTRAYGAYSGNEVLIDKQERFAELNLIQNYATAKSIYVKVVTSDNRPVKDASVEYQLYNYAEFYPIAKGTTDTNGVNSIITGLGDLLIWVYEGEKWGYKKISVDKMDSVTVVITDAHPNKFSETFDLNPPVEKSPLLSKVTQKQIDENIVKLHQEDSIRTLYMGTFRDSAWVASFAIQQGLPADKLMPIFNESYGNWKEIADFISGTESFRKPWTLYLLESISEKDIRDTKAVILTDHVSYSLKYEAASNAPDSAFFARYVMNGRIANEMMLPWRAFLQQKFGADFSDKLNSDVNVLVEWIKSNIKIDNISNLHSRAPLSPRGVYELKVSDKRSRDIFFVAVCRSLGQAARINPETGFPQHYSGKEWHNIVFEPIKENITKKGFIYFTNHNESTDPKYAINFTIARYDGGTYHTIEFEYSRKLSAFDKRTEVEAGKYLLVTGNRQSDGSVLSSVTFFEVPAEVTTEVKVEIRQNYTPAVPWAKINTSAYKFRQYDSHENIALNNLAAQKGAILIWIDPDKEPSKHVIADIQEVKGLIEKWGGGMMFLFTTDKVSRAFNRSNFKGLPSQTKFAYDSQSEMLTAIGRLRSTKCSDNLPVIVITNKKGNLIYYSEGYKIGIGDQIAKAIAPLK